ncbi:MAG: hypothetical protein Q8R00_02465 [Candidatus Nanoarchaeia archaeon]|nr:hypothetical protein [Candidatus Nanoarchaeia archaeon]
MDYRLRLPKGIIDPTPADNGAGKTQREWIDFFNARGQAMMSPPDFYKAPDSVLLSLREDFNDGCLVTSTKMFYNSNGLGTRIVHNLGSKVVEPIERTLVVPVYIDESVENVAKGEGLKYLQFLFDTEDDTSKLIDNWKKIADILKDIRILTPDESSRIDYSEKVIIFRFGYSLEASSCNDRFYVDGSSCFNDSYGLSRGVSVKPVRKRN